MAEIILTDENFDQEVLKSDVPVLVDFWAPWCGPCQQMGPIVEQLAAEIDSSKAKIAKLNVDESQVTPGKYNIMSIPTFLVFKAGAVVDQAVGGMQKAQLEELLSKHTS